jgi:hypothetical protein
MADVIEKLKNYKFDIDMSSYRKKIDLIKNKNKPIIRKIKYISENSQGKLVVKKPRFLRNKPSTSSVTLVKKSTPIKMFNSSKFSTMLKNSSLSTLKNSS